MSVDLDALLVALVLAPPTFSRNRFFSLYNDPTARRVRRRASTLRSIVRHLAAGAGVERTQIAPAEHGATLTYEVPSLGLKRTATLDALELSVVRFAVARGARQAPEALPEALRPEPWDKPAIEAALARLLPAEHNEPPAEAPGAGIDSDQGRAGEPAHARE